ncbi:hypothetical protein BIW11_10653 [Tropilaelaps mercedesae]|uniref:Uncharacterized protein n=1 Tax=Tropilaelaps mercedesae TaxID=418985 RepID=A0A1V9XEL1_9ACAR|nr:hypothetical protein BIW11_10653 [Tropilaelaps mercedesae]
MSSKTGLLEVAKRAAAYAAVDNHVKDDFIGRTSFQPGATVTFAWQLPTEFVLACDVGSRSETRPRPAPFHHCGSAGSNPRQESAVLKSSSRQDRHTS